MQRGPAPPFFSAECMLTLLKRCKEKRRETPLLAGTDLHRHLATKDEQLETRINTGSLSTLTCNASCCHAFPFMRSQTLLKKGERVNRKRLSNAITSTTAPLTSVESSCRHLPPVVPSRLLPLSCASEPPVIALEERVKR